MMKIIAVLASPHQTFVFVVAVPTWNEVVIPPVTDNLGTAICVPSLMGFYVSH